MLDSKQDAIDAINLAADFAEVEQEKLAGIREIDSVKDLAAELGDAKEAAITDIDHLVESLTESGYTAEGWQEVLDEQSKAIEAINDASDFAGVDLAKDDGFIAINDAVNNLNSDDYSTQNWQEILDAQTEAIIAINDAKTSKDIEEGKVEGLAKIDEVQSLKEAAKEALDEYLATLTNPSDEDKL